MERDFLRSKFDGTDTVNYIVSISEKKYKFMNISSGFLKLEEDEVGFTDGDLDELRDNGFDSIE